MSFGPDPTSRHPILDQPSMVFLKPIITNPQIEVGDYTYYHSFDDPLGFERNVRYAFPFIGDRLVVGCFCSIAHGATFILNGGNHLTGTVSILPVRHLRPGLGASDARSLAQSRRHRGRP